VLQISGISPGPASSRKSDVDDWRSRVRSELISQYIRRTLARFCPRNPNRTSFARDERMEPDCIQQNVNGFWRTLLLGSSSLSPVQRTLTLMSLSIKYPLGLAQYVILHSLCPCCCAAVFDDEDPFGQLNLASAVRDIQDGRFADLGAGWRTTTAGDALAEMACEARRSRPSSTTPGNGATRSRFLRVKLKPP